MCNLETVLQHSILTMVHHTHTIGQMSLLEHTTLRLSRLTIVGRQQRLPQLLLPCKVAVMVDDDDDDDDEVEVVDEVAVITTTVLLEHIETL